MNSRLLHELPTSTASNIDANSPGRLHIKNDLSTESARSDRADLQKVSEFELEGHGRLDMPTDRVEKVLSCNCKKTQCLKLYCQCFAYQSHCSPYCKCEACLNNQQNNEKRLAALQAIEMRDGSQVPNKSQLNPSFKRLKSNKGCSCKKSGCLKKYCQCYSLGRKCTDLCICQGCRNPDSKCHDRPTKRPALELLQDEPAAGKRVKQRFLSNAQANQKLNEYLQDLPESCQQGFLSFLLLVLQS